MNHSIARYTGSRFSGPACSAVQRPAVRAAKRAEFIEITQQADWDVSGELWTFQAGTVIAVGASTSLDADPQTVSSRLAVELIRAGKAQAASIRQIEYPALGVSRGELEIKELEIEIKELGLVDIEVVTAEESA